MGTGRAVEMTLGVIAGVVGVLLGLFMIAASGMVDDLEQFLGAQAGGGSGAEVDAQEARALVVTLGAVALVTSSAGIAGAVMVRQRPRTAGAVMLAMGVVGFLALKFLFILPGALFLVAGLMALVRRDRPGPAPVAT